MRRSLVAVLLIAWLRSTAVASPGASVDPPHDPDAADRAPDPGSPWLDLAPSKVLEAHAARPGKRDHKLAAALTLGGLYTAFSTWTYFAWYRKGCRKPPRPCTQFLWGLDGSFGTETYAGGADKLGHAWATMSLARLGTEMLYQWGGYSRLRSTIVGAALSDALFLAVEVRDGFTYEMSYWDFTFDTIGAVLAVAQSLSPRFDELFDFRVQYFPSAAYRAKFEQGDVNVAEDYTGQTYLAALHLGALPGLRGARWAGWARYVDVAVGFETRGYKPDPPYAIDPDDPMRQDYPKRQSIFVGLTLNAQGVFDRLLGGRSPRARKVTRALFEVFNLPYTTLPMLESTRHPAGPTAEDGA